MTEYVNLDFGFENLGASATQIFEVELTQASLLKTGPALTKPERARERKRAKKVLENISDVVESSSLAGEKFED